MKDLRKLKQMKPKEIKAKLKGIGSKELYSIYKEMTYANKHAKVGIAVWDVMLSESGSFSK